MEKIYDLVRQERFTPTSAARAYGAIAVAAYEAVVAGMPANVSLAGQLNGLALGPSPTPGSRIHWPISLNAAVEKTALATFADRSPASRESITEYAAHVRGDLGSEVLTPIAEASHVLGANVGDHVANWVQGDGYNEIIGLPY
ncbi:MAG: phosphoesterase, partial [Acidimicrobiia bacterium]